MLQLFLSGMLKPLAFPLYCFCELTFAGLFVWSIWKAEKDGVARLHRLHQIPCSRCTFFTGDYRLKCTVHPTKALTEEAINCFDYEPINYLATACSKRCKQSGWSISRKAVGCNKSVKRSYLRANSQ